MVDHFKQIQTLKRKQDAILTKLRNAQARQAKADRRRAVRIKILIGVATLRALDRGLIARESLVKLLTENLAEKDRRLFDL